MENIYLKQAEKAERSILKEYYEKRQIEFGVEDGAIYGLFIELIRKTESIAYLAEVEKTGGINSILRSVFEIYIYLSFILEKDTKKRARAYAKKWKVDQAFLFDLLNGDSDDANEVRKFLGITKEEFMHDYSEVFSSSDPEKWRKEFADIFPNQKKMPKQWYNFDGKTSNFYSLCKKLNMSAMYNTLFRVMSADTHSADVVRNFHMTPNYLSVLKNKDSGSDVLGMAEALLKETIVLVLHYYKLNSLERKISTTIAINEKINNREIRFNF